MTLISKPERRLDSSATGKTHDGFEDVELTEVDDQGGTEHREEGGEVAVEDVGNGELVMDVSFLQEAEEAV